MIRRTMKRKFGGQRGFNLIELLIVIAIIGILAAIIIAAVGQMRAKARDVKRIANIKQIIAALNMFYSDKGRYPNAQDGINILGECIGDGVNCGNSNGFENAIRPYMSGGIPKDPRHDCPPGGCLQTSYFYGYDYSHAANLDPNDCTDPADFPGDSDTGVVVISINRLETDTYKKRATCMGNDMWINTADYNTISCTRTFSEGCGSGL